MLCIISNISGIKLIFGNMCISVIFCILSSEISTVLGYDACRTLELYLIS